MEKDNPLLPFAFTRANSGIENTVQLDTTPRSRAVIDENAKSKYHTRTPESVHRTPGPTLKIAPGLKRRMGESFNENDNIKRRTTVFDEVASEEPTMIDSSTDFDNEYPDTFKASFLDKENRHYDNIPPSSPPVDTNLSSEFDNHARFSMPLSPSQRLNSEPNIEPTSPFRAKTQVMQHNLPSETDFGIDKFNRFIPTANQCPSTDNLTASFEDDWERKARSNQKAREIVLNAFDEMYTTIDLSGLGLSEVPHEVKDLNNLVVFGNDATQISYQLFMSNNKIRILSPALFKFTKLNVLAIRQNKIEKLPAMISNLVNLTDLSIGSNRLKFLPFQILNLPYLTSFRAGPNPFLKVPKDSKLVTTATLNPVKNIKYVSQIKYLKQKGKLVPSLRSICLTEIAKYDVSYQETREWRRNTPNLLHQSIKYAISQGNFNETCCMCPRLLVDPVAEVIEWWDILQNKDIPFKKEFCSGMCAEKYRRSVLAETDDDIL